MSDPALARKETIMQAEVAASGFPTPPVRASGGPADGLGRPFMVMDRADGVTLLDAPTGGGVVTRLPQLLTRIPDVLATTMAGLHRVDPSPIRKRFESTGDPVPTIDVLLDWFRGTAHECSRPDLRDATDALAARRPPPGPDVVCHGDLHPINLLVDDAGDATLLDWTASLLGPREYDLAFTSLVLSEPPVDVPRPVRPVLRGAGRWLSRRFLSRYEHHSGVTIDSESLCWHQSVVCLRALAEVAEWAHTGMLEQRAGHPWLQSSSPFAARVSRLTGVEVRPGT
jgi:aminoglycoside phosphotransferase (APT) family kinase protein